MKNTRALVLVHDMGGNHRQFIMAAAQARADCEREQILFRWCLPCALHFIIFVGGSMVYTSYFVGE